MTTYLEQIQLKIITARKIYNLRYLTFQREVIFLVMSYIIIQKLNLKISNRLGQSLRTNKKRMFLLISNKILGKHHRQSSKEYQTHKIINSLIEIL
jgi:hypothetical protein